MINIDISELGRERDALSDFLKSKTKASIIAKGKILILDSAEALSARETKTLVKRFLHHEGLSEVYRVTEERGIVKIVKIKERREQKSEIRSLPPQPSATMPYFFH